MSKKSFTLTSNDLGGTFGSSQVMDKFGCSGDNKSPHLKWENAPDGTKSFAIFMHDPDAPTNSGFWHWAVYNIPASTTELEAGAGEPDNNLMPEGVTFGKIDTGRAAYDGPCPPEGDFHHRYIITVYALDKESIDVKSETPISQVEFTIVTQHMLDKASIIAYYKK